MLVVVISMEIRKIAEVGVDEHLCLLFHWRTRLTPKWPKIWLEGSVIAKIVCRTTYLAPQVSLYAQ